MISSTAYLDKLNELEDLDYSSFDDSVKSEPVFAVDLNTRVIKVPSDFRELAVEGDHNAETIWFIAKRMFDGIDLLEKTWNIQFINALGESCIRPMTYKYSGAADDIDENDGINIPDDRISDDEILLGWKITYDMTKAAGSVSFGIRCFEMDENDELTYSLNTEYATATIADSLFLTNDTENTNPPADDLTKLLAQIENFLAGDGSITNKIDYANVTSKPKINGITLNTGNTSTTVLGLDNYNNLKNKPIIVIDGVEYLLQDKVVLPVTSGGSGDGETVDGVDTVLSDVSPNPVQNKVITSKIQDMLEMIANLQDEVAILRAEVDVLKAGAGWEGELPVAEVTAF